jgi:glycosyltransferase involved in cell wall biosynthesis
VTRSLSVLLPVHNAQSYLEPLVDGLVEVLPELTSDFEVLIVDNGSTDDTGDAASHLMARYPQVAMLVNDARLEGEAMLRSALAVARGEIIFLREEGCELDLHDIGKLWARMSRRQLVIARPLAASGANRPRQASGASPMSVWEQSVLDSIRPASATRASSIGPGFKMMWSSVANESPWWIASSSTLIADLTDRGYSCEEIALRPTSDGTADDAGGVIPPAHLDGPKSPLRRRPNYLARILAITSGN